MREIVLSKASYKVTMTTIQTDPSQAQARKRRKQILASYKTAKRTRTIPAAVIVGSEENNSTASSPVCSPITKRKKVCNPMVIKSNTKYQNRYEPDVPMSKEEEAEWRKEARRQRNRESAAASRNKIRSRIQELENEVEDWKTKYESLMRRIDLLEKDTAPPPSLPNLTSQQQGQVSPLSSPQIAPKSIYVPSSISLSTGEEKYDLSVPIIPDCASSSSSSKESSSTLTTNEQINSAQNVTQKYVDLHVIENTSRPAASR